MSYKRKSQKVQVRKVVNDVTLYLRARGPTLGEISYALGEITEIKI